MANLVELVKELRDKTGAGMLDTGINIHKSILVPMFTYM